MALFGGKSCCICGGKAGLLTRMKLQDGNYVCGDCTMKVSDQLKSDDYKRLSKSMFEKCMKEAPANDRKYREEFQETFAIYAGSGTSHKAFAADETHGWWVCPEFNRPIVFNFSEINSWSVRMNTLPNDEDDEKDKGLLDMFADFAQSSYFASMRANHPELPTCPPGRHVTSMDVYISVSNPYVRDAVIDIWEPGWFTNDHEDMQNAYNAAIQIIEYLQRVKGQGNGAFAGQYNANPYAGNAYNANPYGTAAPFQGNAGGYQRAGQAAPQAAPSAQAGAAADPTAELRKYKGLLDEGIITQEEFDAKKRQLLGI